MRRCCEYGEVKLIHYAECLISAVQPDRKSNK